MRVDPADHPASAVEVDDHGQRLWIGRRVDPNRYLPGWTSDRPILRRGRLVRNLPSPAMAAIAARASAGLALRGAPVARPPPSGRAASWTCGSSGMPHLGGSWGQNEPMITEPVSGSARWPEGRLCGQSAERRPTATTRPANRATVTPCSSPIYPGASYSEEMECRSTSTGAETCDTRFEARRPMSEAAAPINCPDGHLETTRLLSVFASVGHGAESASLSAAGARPVEAAADQAAPACRSDRRPSPPHLGLLARRPTSGRVPLPVEMRAGDRA